MTGEPPVTTPPASIEGTVQHMYSDSDGCICCDGPHKHGSRVTVSTDLSWHYRQQSSYGGYTDVLYAAGFVGSVIRPLPDGTRIRITIETIDDDDA